MYSRLIQKGGIVKTLFFFFKKKHGPKGPRLPYNALRKRGT